MEPASEGMISTEMRKERSIEEMRRNFIETITSNTQRYRLSENTPRSLHRFLEYASVSHSFGQSTFETHLIFEGLSASV